jgi:hypothetical protein
MRYQFLFTISLLLALSVSSCKKDDDDDMVAATCTETRPLWLDGSAGDFSFVTSEPCGALKLSEVDVSQTQQGMLNIFVFSNEQNIVDSNGTSRGKLYFSINIQVPGEKIDSFITPTDTTLTVSPNNICSEMKLGEHYLYLHEAISNNANGFWAVYVDSIGKEWRIALGGVNDSLAITSIDGIISQSPFPGAFFPYCTCTFSYNLLMQEHQGADTLRLQGTGRLGFR